MENLSFDNLRMIQEKLREKGRFSKYCKDCGEIFGSDDIQAFLEMVEEHKCKAIK